MAHNPAFDFQLDPLNTAFLGEDLSDVSSIAESINYELNDAESAKLAMIRSARALLADAEQRLARYQVKVASGNVKKNSASDKKKKLTRLRREVKEAEVWLNTLINS
jgi:hypothetical protein